VTLNLACGGPRQLGDELKSARKFKQKLARKLLAGRYDSCFAVPARRGNGPPVGYYGLCLHLSAPSRRAPPPNGRGLPMHDEPANRPAAREPKDQLFRRQAHSFGSGRAHGPEAPQLKWRTPEVKGQKLREGRRELPLPLWASPNPMHESTQGVTNYGPPPKSGSGGGRPQ